MGKKPIVLTIDEEVLKKVKDLIGGVGGSVSAVVEGMLKNFVEMMELENGEREKVKKNFGKELENTRKRLNKIKSITGGDTKK